MRPRSLCAVAMLALLAMLGGCYKATFVRNVPPAGPVVKERASFYVFGLVGVHEVDVREHCPDGQIRIVRTGGDIGTGLLTVVTLGLYAPRRVWIQCGASQVGRPAGDDGAAQREGDGGAP